MSVVWKFLKAHWHAITVVIVIAFSVFWFHHQQTGFAATLSQLNVSHQAEIDKINSDKLLEEQQHAAEQKQLQDSLNEIQANYVAAQAQLQQRQSAEASQIVSKYSTDPNSLANLLASKFGFVVTN
jgi:hypothetical protein